MGQTRHEKSFVDYDKAYEQNIIGLKGIVYFGIGLLVLIVITFGLMWALLGVLASNAEEQNKATANPMRASEIERLPPEPRLQAAPGFKVEGQNGRVNLELMAPQAEYRTIRAEWEEEWKKGRVDHSTGAITSIPIEEAKAKILGQNLKTRTGVDADQLMRQSQMIISDGSSGRIASLKRR
jgi:hypothetical protein